jgi:hypothetical protein
MAGRGKHVPGHRATWSTTLPGELNPRMGPPTQHQSPMDPRSNIGSTSRSKGKEPAKGDETRMFSTDEAEQLFDRKLARSMDGLRDYQKF